MSNKYAPRKGATGPREAFRIGDLNIADADKPIAAQFAREAQAMLTAGLFKSQQEAEKYVLSEMRDYLHDREQARRWARG